MQAVNAAVCIQINQSGRLAQLGERRVRNAEVASSILAPSTNLRFPVRRRLPAEALAKAGLTLLARSYGWQANLRSLSGEGCRAEAGWLDPFTPSIPDHVSRFDILGADDGTRRQAHRHSDGGR